MCFFKIYIGIRFTKYSWGIENLYYAYILVEKGEDSDNILMQERYWSSVLTPVRFVLLLKTIFSRKIVL